MGSSRPLAFFVPQGKRKGEGSSGLGPTLDRDGGPLPFYQAFGDVEAQTQAGEAAARRLDPPEPLEHALLLLDRNPDPEILDPDASHAGVMGDPHEDAVRLRRIL